MSRKFIATILAASVAIAGFGAAPAKAGDGRDMMRVIAGVATIAIIASAIDNKRDQRRSHEPVYVEPPRHQKPAPKVHHHKKREKETVYQQVKPRPLPQRVSRAVLPGQCLRNVEARRGTVQVFGKGCLTKNYNHVNALPQQCEVSFRAPNGRYRTGYGAHCLGQFGYQVSRR